MLERKQSLATGSETGSKKQTKVARQRRSVDPLAPPPRADSFPDYVQRDYFRYELVHQSAVSGARVGRIHTPHGVVDTPGFVPVVILARPLLSAVISCRRSCLVHLAA